MRGALLKKLLRGAAGLAGMVFLGGTPQIAAMRKALDAREADKQQGVA